MLSTSGWHGCRATSLTSDAMRRAGLTGRGRPAPRPGLPTEFWRASRAVGTSRNHVVALYTQWKFSAPICRHWCSHLAQWGVSGPCHAGFPGSAAGAGAERGAQPAARAGRARRRRPDGTKARSSARSHCCGSRTRIMELGRGRGWGEAAADIAAVLTGAQPRWRQRRPRFRLDQWPVATRRQCAQPRGAGRRRPRHPPSSLSTGIG